MTTAPQTATDERDTHTRWNFAAICGESASFQAGMVWADPFTVVAQFIGLLGGSTVLVGLLQFLQRVGYMLPQLPMAAIVGHRPRRRPYLRWGVLIFRLPFIAFVVYLWRAGVARPEVVLPFMLFAYFSVSFGNGVVALPWQDIIAKSIPPSIRGRFFGTMQFATAAAGFAIGFAVQYFLGPRGLAYPANYVLLFFLAAVFFTGSTVGCWLMREPVRPVLEQPERLREIVAGVPRFLREEGRFRNLVLVSMLGTGLTLTRPFFTVYAVQRLGLAPQTVGLFIIAATLGGALFSLLWGHLNDTRGPRTPIRWCASLIFLTPLLALALPPLTRGLEAWWGCRGALLPYSFATVFLVAGASANGLWIATNNYLFDLASHEERPRYIAILATLAAPGALIPVVVGKLLESLSYPVVFGLMALVGAWVCLLARRLPESR